MTCKNCNDPVEININKPKMINNYCLKCFEQKIKHGKFCRKCHSFYSLCTYFSYCHSNAIECLKCSPNYLRSTYCDECI